MMAENSDRALNRTRLRSWVQNIPLGSLEQLQNATPDRTSGGAHSNASNVPLPGSATLSLVEATKKRTVSDDLAATSLPSTPRSTNHETLQTTSQGSLWQLQHAAETFEHQIPLPESAHVSEEQLPLDQAEATESVHSTHASQGLPRSPSRNRDVPDSVGPTVGWGWWGRATQQDHVDAIVPLDVQPPRRRNYWQSTATLMDCLPHLQAIQPDHGRYKNSGSITCIDYFRDRRAGEVHDSLSISQSETRRAFTDRLMELKVIANPQVTTRLILVEDLSSGVIESLGSTFELDPELFAEHLNRSGYNGVDYEDELPSRWETNEMSKAHVTLKWYRPIHENPKITQWLEKPQSLLERVEDPTIDLNGTSESSEHSRIPRVKRAETMPVWFKKPGIVLGRTRTQHGRMVGNDDTEMTGRRKIPGSITWADPLYTVNGKRRKHAMLHQAVVATNIFRQSWLLATRPSRDRDDHEEHSRWKLSSKARKTNRAFARAAHVVRKSSDDAWESSAAPTAWEEKASFFHYRKSSVPIIILLLDPLPTITDFQRSLNPSRADNETRSISSSVTARAKEASIDMGLPIVARIPRKFPANKFDATSEDIERLKLETSTLISTGEAICVGGNVGSCPWLEFRADPLLVLLRVLQNDSKAFFQCLEWALDEISEDSLDDYLMSKRLEAWRRLMSEFEIKVPAISRSLQEFVTFVFDDGKGTPMPEEIKSILEDVQREAERIHRRLIESYGALRADMQFTESRRSINEAKTVTKLTELAFLFIPLSFTCSLFSMQIHELSGGVPVWTFIVTALAIAILAYVIRLVLASDFIADSSRSALEKFWEQRGVRRGDSAPVFTLVLLTIQEVWHQVSSRFSVKALYAMVLASFIVVPVILMWTTTKMDVGFDVAMTLFLVLSGLALGISLFVDPGSIGERVTGWQGDASSVTSGEDV